MPDSNELYDELAKKALKIRRNIVNMIYMASSGRISVFGSSYRFAFARFYGISFGGE